MSFFSFNTLASSGVYYAFENSDLCGKSIVVLLLFSSIVAWSIMLEKWLSVKRLGDSSASFIHSFGQKRTFLMSIADSKNNIGPAASIYRAALVKIMEFHGANEARLASMVQMGRKPEKPLTEPQLAVIRATVDKEMSDQIKILESRMGFLSTCVSAPPFFGLFGTVWGVMLAFCSLAERGRAEINALAPGVAGALLTTVAGLIVAIPSLIGYNLLTASISSQITDLEDFAEQMMAQLRVEQTEYEDEPVPVRQAPQVQAQTQVRVQTPVQQAQPPQYQAPSTLPPRPQTVFVPNPASTADDDDPSSVQPNLLNS